MKISNEIIFKDIAGFKARIAAARVKLAELKLKDPPSNWKQRNKEKAKRREFEGEITHVNNLIAIARSALTPFESQPGKPYTRLYVPSVHLWKVPLPYGLCRVRAL